MVVFVIFPNEPSWSAPLPPQSASLQSMHVQLSCLRSFFLSQKAQWLLPLSKGKVILAWFSPKTYAEQTTMNSSSWTASQAPPWTTCSTSFHTSLSHSLLVGRVVLFLLGRVLPTHGAAPIKINIHIFFLDPHPQYHHGWHKLARGIVIGLSHMWHMCLCVWEVHT